MLDTSQRSDQKGTAWRNGQHRTSSSQAIKGGVITLLGIVVIGSCVNYWDFKFAYCNSDNAVFISKFNTSETVDERGILVEKRWGERPLKKRSTISDNSTDYQKFLVITSQRSGSGWLSKLLDNHTDITCGQELLLHDKHLYSSKVSSKTFANATDDKIHTLCQQQEQPATKLVGFKIMYGQGFLVHGKSLVEEWTSRGYKIIHLIRRNKLLQFFSALEMQQGIKKHLGEAAHPERPDLIAKLRKVKVNVTANQTIQALDIRFAETAEASSYLSLGDVTTVYYEDLMDDTIEEMNRLFRFLGVDPQPVQSSFLKIHSEPRIRDYFMNDDTLREKYRYDMSRSVYSYLMTDW